MRLLSRGKVKEVYEAGEGELLFKFTDNISVFDKIIPSSVPKKGETLCRTSAFWFDALNSKGIRNHFISASNDSMRVKRVQVISDYSMINGDTRNYLIPLEVICRHYVAGTLFDKIKEGKIKGTALGFPGGHVPRYGEKLPMPFIEFTTKLEAVDRKLTEDEARKISGLSEDEMSNIKRIVLDIDEMISEIAGRSGLIHVDGKKEFAMDENRHMMVVDTFGTLDEDRWWDIKEWNRGAPSELSKELVRKFYRESGYFEKLSFARDKGWEEPEIPAMPPEFVAQVSDLYVMMFERITGQKF